MPDEQIISPARWYETQAELARAQEVAREAAIALAGLIGAAQGVVTWLGSGRFPALERQIADGEAALCRLHAVASAGAGFRPAAEPLPLPTTAAELPDVLRREGGL